MYNFGTTVYTDTNPTPGQGITYTVSNNRVNNYNMVHKMSGGEGSALSDRLHFSSSTIIVPKFHF